MYNYEQLTCLLLMFPVIILFWLMSNFFSLFLNPHSSSCLLLNPASLLSIISSFRSCISHSHLPFQVLSINFFLFLKFPSPYQFPSSFYPILCTLVLMHRNILAIICTHNCRRETSKYSGYYMYS